MWYGEIPTDLPEFVSFQYTHSIRRGALPNLAATTALLTWFALADYSRQSFDGLVITSDPVVELPPDHKVMISVSRIGIDDD